MPTNLLHGRRRHHDDEIEDADSSRGDFCRLEEDDKQGEEDAAKLPSSANVVATNTSSSSSNLPSRSYNNNNVVVIPTSKDMSKKPVVVVVSNNFAAAAHASAATRAAALSYYNSSAAATSVAHNNITAAAATTDGGGGVAPGGGGGPSAVRRRYRYPMSDIVFPTSHDVLFGRGSATNEHSGNVQFRRLVAVHRMDYVRAPKFQKHKVVDRVVHLWRNHQYPPGRFLTKKTKFTTSTPNHPSQRIVGNDDDDDDDSCYDYWYDVGDDEAKKKTTTCLRRRTKNKKKERPTTATSIDDDVPPSSSAPRSGATTKLQLFLHGHGHEQRENNTIATITAAVPLFASATAASPSCRSPSTTVYERTTTNHPVAAPSFFASAADSTCRRPPTAPAPSFFASAAAPSCRRPPTVYDYTNCAAPRSYHPPALAAAAVPFFASAPSRRPPTTYDYTNVAVPPPSVPERMTTTNYPPTLAAAAPSFASAAPRKEEDPELSIVKETTVRHVRQEGRAVDPTSANTKKDNDVDEKDSTKSGDGSAPHHFPPRTFPLELIETSSIGNITDCMENTSTAAASGMMTDSLSTSSWLQSFQSLQQEKRTMTVPSSRRNSGFTMTNMSTTAAADSQLRRMLLDESNHVDESSIGAFDLALPAVVDHQDFDKSRTANLQKLLSTRGQMSGLSLLSDITSDFERRPSADSGRGRRESGYSIATEMSDGLKSMDLEFQ